MISSARRRLEEDDEREDDDDPDAVALSAAAADANVEEHDPDDCTMNNQTGPTTRTATSQTALRTHVRTAVATPMTGMRTWTRLFNIVSCCCVAPRACLA